MGGILDDLERRIDEERARAQQRKLEEAKKKAEQEAQRLAALRRRNESGWLL